MGVMVAHRVAKLGVNPAIHFLENILFKGNLLMYQSLTNVLNQCMILSIFLPTGNDVTMLVIYLFMVTEESPCNIVVYCF